MDGPVLSDRSRRILAALVRDFIDTGEPVSSQALVEHGGFHVSSATLRNELARLEELGYVHQPHTSAGRVPTDAGYRFHVDLLMEARRRTRPASAVEAELMARAGHAPLMDDALASVSHVLSLVSHHLGFVVPPAVEQAEVHQIDFVPLGGNKVLVVVIESGGRVINKVIDTGEIIGTVELRQAANYLNSQFSGLTLAEVRAQVTERMKWERSLYDTLLALALRLAQAARDEIAPRTTLFVDGASSLFDAVVQSSGGVSMDTLRALLQLIEEKDRLVRLLTVYLEGPGLTVVIGAEHTSPDLREFSLVAAPFGDGQRLGAVGIIGPTRMQYARAITVGERVASTRSHLLSGGTWDSTWPRR